MDKRNFYYLQNVKEDELDEIFTLTEKEIGQVVERLIGLATLFKDLKPYASGTPDFNVSVYENMAFVQESVSLTNKVGIIYSGQAIDCSTDKDTNSTVPSPGSKRYISVFAKYVRTKTNDIVDGHGATIQYNWDDDVAIEIWASAEGASPSPVSTPDVNYCLLFDVLLNENVGTTGISDPADPKNPLDNEIDYTRVNFNNVNFTELGDTPNSLTGQGGYLLRVNFAEDGIEFTSKVSGADKLTKINDRIIFDSIDKAKALLLFDIDAERKIMKEDSTEHAEGDLEQTYPQPKIDGFSFLSNSDFDSFAEIPISLTEVESIANTLEDSNEYSQSEDYTDVYNISQILTGNTSLWQFDKISAEGLRKDSVTNNAEKLTDGVDFNYDSRLDQVGGSDVDIYDDGDVGSFTAGKFMRIVHDGDNVSKPVASGGIELPIYAKKMATFSGSDIVSKDDYNYHSEKKVFIDPESRIFKMPMPVFWQDFENSSMYVDNWDMEDIDLVRPFENIVQSLNYLQMADRVGRLIGETDDSGGTIDNWSISAGTGEKIGIRHFEIWYDRASPALDKNHFFGMEWLNADNYAPMKMTLSFWLQSITWSNSAGLIISLDGSHSDTGRPPHRIEILENSQELYINNALVDSSTFAFGTSVYRHVYIVFDTNAGITGGKTVEVFIDKVSQMSTTTVPVTSSYQSWGFSAAKTSGSASGLANDATTYTATINIDGTEYPISIVGNAAQNLGDVCSEIDTDLGSVGTCAFDSTGNGFIKITSATTGDSSSVNITDTDLFSSLTDVNSAPETQVRNRLRNGTWFWCILDETGTGDDDCYYSLDNLKMWDDIVDESADWIYDLEDLAVVADAMHPIYGSANEYKPKLTSIDAGGVGYYSYIDHRCKFTPDINKLESGKLAKLAFFLQSIGSGYTSIDVQLHNSSDVNVGSAIQIPIENVLGGKNEIDYIADLTQGSDYHFHIYVSGFGAGTKPIAPYNQKDGSFLFFNKYKTLGGLFGSDSNDVIKLTDEDGDKIVIEFPNVISLGENFGHIDASFFPAISDNNSFSDASLDSVKKKASMSFHGKNGRIFEISDHANPDTIQLNIYNDFSKGVIERSQVIGNVSGKIADGFYDEINEVLILTYVNATSGNGIAHIFDWANLASSSSVEIETTAGEARQITFLIGDSSSNRILMFTENSSGNEMLTIIDATIIGSIVLKVNVLTTAIETNYGETDVLVRIGFGKDWLKYILLCKESEAIDDGKWKQYYCDWTTVSNLAAMYTEWDANFGTVDFNGVIEKETSLGRTFNLQEIEEFSGYVDGSTSVIGSYMIRKQRSYKYTNMIDLIPVIGKRYPNTIMYANVSGFNLTYSSRKIIKDSATSPTSIYFGRFIVDIYALDVVIIIEAIGPTDDAAPEDLTSFKARAYNLKDKTWLWDDWKEMVIDGKNIIGMSIDSIYLKVFRQHLDTNYYLSIDFYNLQERQEFGKGIRSFDYTEADLSNATYYNNFHQNKCIAIDRLTSNIKFPSDNFLEHTANVYAEFNIHDDNLFRTDAKSLSEYSENTPDRSIADKIKNIEDIIGMSHYNTPVNENNPFNSYDLDETGILGKVYEHKKLLPYDLVIESEEDLASVLIKTNNTTFITNYYKRVYIKAGGGSLPADTNTVHGDGAYDLKKILDIAGIKWGNSSGSCILHFGEVYCEIGTEFSAKNITNADTGMSLFNFGFNDSVNGEGKLYNLKICGQGNTSGTTGSGSSKIYNGGSGSYDVPSQTRVFDNVLYLEDWAYAYNVEIRGFYAQSAIQGGGTTLSKGKLIKSRIIGCELRGGHSIYGLEEINEIQLKFVNVYAFLSQNHHFIRSCKKVKNVELTALLHEGFSDATARVFNWVYQADIVDNVRMNYIGYYFDTTSTTTVNGFQNCERIKNIYVYNYFGSGTGARPSLMTSVNNINNVIIESSFRSDSLFKSCNNISNVQFITVFSGWGTARIFDNCNNISEVYYNSIRGTGDAPYFFYQCANIDNVHGSGDWGNASFGGNTVFYQCERISNIKMFFRGNDGYSIMDDCHRINNIYLYGVVTGSQETIRVCSHITNAWVNMQNSAAVEFSGSDNLMNCDAPRTTALDSFLNCDYLVNCIAGKEFDTCDHIVNCVGTKTACTNVVN